MALSKEKKAEVVSDIEQLLVSSKMTVMANYSGTSVKAMQELRTQAGEQSTQVKVLKNRLFKKALSGNEKLAGITSEDIKGQLLYAFSAEDEVAPAQVLASFAKTQDGFTFIGAISADGQLLSADDVKVLAALPTKDQLRAQLVGTISAPISGFVGVMAGNVRGLMNVLNARAESL